MLCVRIDGREVKTTPAMLARLVFEGGADRDSWVKVPGETAEQPLEQCIGAPHCEALAGELHRRLGLMGSMDSSAVDLYELRVQVERLCQWRWPSSPVTARFYWAAGWLNELADHMKNAIAFYDAFLLMPTGESHLRLLALNNRGVLQIRLGRLEGVGDLARAAIADCDVPKRGPTGLTGPAGATGLPAACFNLLNLINVAFGTADLLRAVDEELMTFFSRFGPEVRRFWLEPPSSEEGHGLAPGPSSPTSREQDSGLPILRDPTYKRLNSLVTRLAAHARPLADEAGRPMDRISSAFHHLSLWNNRLDGDAAPRPRAERDSTGASGSFVHGQHHRYAEATTLLLSEDIPSSLARQNDPLARLEQSAREELAVIDRHVAAGQYDLAKSRLQVQRNVLSSLNGRPGLAALLGQVDAQLERIAGLELQEQRLQLQRMCAGFVSEVQEFCSLTDVSQAESTGETLRGRLQRYKAGLPSWTGHEVMTLLDELAIRVQHHTHNLRRGEIEMRIADPLRHLRQHRPSDGTVPIPESVYQALDQCRFHDPEGWIEDWAALEEQLDAQQAQHFVHKALSALRGDPGSWDRVQDDLTRALTYRPDQWLKVAPLFGLSADAGGWPETHTPSPPFADRPSAMPMAGRLLERTLQQIGLNAQKCMRLWQCVETTLLPLAAGRDAESLAQARTLAERYLDHWPAGLHEGPGRADPRNPVNHFLETCEKARHLILAEQGLSARPPQCDKAKSHLLAACRLGLETRDQLRRVVTGLYLAQFHEMDAPPVQRRVLAALEAWVNTVSPEIVPRMQEQEIVEEMQNVRMAADRPVPVTQPV